MLAVQVKAGHASTPALELTDTALREGTEVLAVDEIEAVFPEPENTVKAAGFMEKWQGRTLGVNATGPLEKWQTSCALGELSGVPRAAPRSVCNSPAVGWWWPGRGIPEAARGTDPLVEARRA